MPNKQPMGNELNFNIEIILETGLQFLGNRWKNAIRFSDIAF